MSNAVGLVSGSVSGTWGFRRELAGQKRRLRWQIPASLLSAATGAWLLLPLPESALTSLVPMLLVLALALVIAGPAIQSWAKRRAERAGEVDPEAPVNRVRGTLLVVGTFLVGIYGGYFTAAQGILVMGVMGALLNDSMRSVSTPRRTCSSGWSTWWRLSRARSWRSTGSVGPPPD